MLDKILFVLVNVFILDCLAQRGSIPCYDTFGGAQRCVPPFENLAYKKKIESTNTCGLNGPSDYCLQIGSGQRGNERDTLECRKCDDSIFERSHSARFLTDFNNNDNMTWWQSETMLEGIQHPNTVNLTLPLGKEFEITYVRLRFKSSRPESMAIYKRTHDGGPWIPYQYFSASCYQTYNLRRDETITAADETKAICTDEYSDIIPLSGANVVFSTLKGRPGAFNFDENIVLQDWVTATDIKIVLSRINTYGDEVFKYFKVLQSYFYGISDFAVGGRCKCNGHASECTPSTGQGLEVRYACNCEHSTEGRNCETCKPFYNNRPWDRATADDANECQACDCNGLADRCYFDEELYQRTTQGGHCLECRENTAGPHCERCKDLFFRRSPLERCEPCNCDPTGSENEQCDEQGRCQCKNGVTGDRCDRCEDNYYDFGPFGCRPCQCNVAGSRENRPVCSEDNGNCQCKEYVEGQNCDSCKPGYFGLDTDNDLGCLSCFCYGHSSVCESARGFRTKVIHSDFSSGTQGWMGETRDGRPLELEFNGIVGNVGISAPTSEMVYFVAPERYLGDQRYSYSQDLSFTLRVGEEGARPSVTDLVIEGDGMKITLPLYYQSNPLPRTLDQDYKFTLHEHQNYQWTPSLNSREFIKLLSNITAIKIRGTFASQGVGFLDSVKLESAREGGQGDVVTHIERCTCVDGYIGQFCDECAPGYHRDPPHGGPLARCVPCNCNGHSEVCEVDTGKCICRHNTVGDNCERCSPGYYGYALSGTADDCQACPCPDGGECVELLNNDVACINCKEGYTGNRCGMCSDGYFGNPANGVPCERCACNDNIDPNAVRNCDSMTGECLKCIYNTDGFHCDRCLTGFYGDALALPKGQCVACSCYMPGSYSSNSNELVSCDPSGQCPCLSNVIGKECRECRPGYWNIDSENGCEQCNCDDTGSHNRTCSISDGQCHCQPGVTGRRCDQCQDNYFGFSAAGCRDCECDPFGSTSLQCNLYTGQCPCKTNIEGKMCDRCMENKFNISAGCIDCPACYNLVQDAVNDYRRKLNELNDMISNIGDNPQNIDDLDFRRKLAEVNDSVNALLEDARKAVGGDGSLIKQLSAMKAALTDVMEKCGRIAGDIAAGRSSSDRSLVDIAAAEKAIAAAEKALRDAESYIEVEGAEALRKAKAAQDKAGQQSNRMTEIAKQARSEVERQEEEADMIQSTASEALNTSREAHRVARDALQMPMDTASKITDINRDLSNANALLEQTRVLSRQALEQAEDAYKQSLAIYVEADGITMPVIDVDGLKDEAQGIKDEASRIKLEAEQLMDDHRQLLEDVSRQKQDAQLLLERGVQQQQITDELLADADNARNIALEAVAKAEQTLREANETLKTLREFDQKVQESKALAEEAFKKIPGIEDQIKEAEDTTRMANDNLEDAEADAVQARDLAEVAKVTAEMASQDASKVKEDSALTKQKAVDLNDAADTLSGEVSDAATRLEALETQAQEDERLAREALAKADQAKAAAVESSNDVKMALRDVNEILRQLGGLPSIDEDKLDELEANLASAEQELAASDISAKYDDILAARNQQFMWVTDYTTELLQLHEDVENVRVINETIPRKCFKKLILEPTDPSGKK